MKIPKLNKKEQLVFNELIHKHKLSNQFNRKDILTLHEELAGNLRIEWIQKYFNKKKWGIDQVSEIYSLLIYPLTYPSMKLRNGSFGKINSFYWENRIQPYRENVIRCARSVGRILRENPEKKFTTIASGVMISKDWILTVAKPFIDIEQVKGGFKLNNRYWVDFSETKKNDIEENLFEVEGLVIPKKTLSNSLINLRLKHQTRSGLKLPLPIQVIKEYKHPEIVVVIGYPLKMAKPKERLLINYAVFGSPWQMGGKRIAPGHLMQEQFEIYHDCSVSFGSEGSPIINLKTGEVIGVHINRDEKKEKIIQRIDLNYFNQNFT